MINPDKLLLDTCALIWFASGDKRLSSKNVQIIKDAGEEDRLFASVISLWEIGYLVRKSRLDLQDLSPAEFWQQLKERINLRAVGITEAIVLQYHEIGDSMHNDPGDRFITASAINHHCRLVTGDLKLIAWAKENNYSVLSL